MTMLTHVDGPLQRIIRPFQARARAGTPGAAHLGAIRRFFVAVLTALVATAAIAGAISLVGINFPTHFSN